MVAGFSGGEEEQVGLLRELVAGGVRVRSLREETSSFEELLVRIAGATRDGHE